MIEMKTYIYYILSGENITLILSKFLFMQKYIYTTILSLIVLFTLNIPVLAISGIDTTNVSWNSKPYMVWLEKANGNPVGCNAVAVAPSIVVTSAHCIHATALNLDLRQESLRVRTNTSATLPVIDKRFHRDYNAFTNNPDIVVLNVNGNLPNYIQVGDAGSLGVDFTFLSWRDSNANYGGANNTSTLSTLKSVVAKITAISDPCYLWNSSGFQWRTCNSSYRASFSTGGKRVTFRDGDSGGAMIVDNKLVGLLTTGYQDLGTFQRINNPYLDIVSAGKFKR